MNRDPLPIAERAVDGATGPLKFPAAVAADIEGNLAVADTGHHRVLYGQMVGNSFAVRKTIGTTEPGFVDGSFDEARFHGPHGMTLLGDMLIVADRGNHALRMIDLTDERVATMAGTGEPAPGPIVAGPALESPLDSPWDVVTHDYRVFVALAGPRRIVRLDLPEGTLGHHADAGEEPEDAAEATSWIPPLTLASDDDAWLYFADAASSRVGRVGFGDDADVETLVEVRAGGLAWGHGNHRLWIADRENDELKLFDPESGRLETLDPFDETLSGPMGLTSTGHLLYVTDTDRHRVLRVDQVDKRVVTLEVELD